MVQQAPQSSEVLPAQSPIAQEPPTIEAFRRLEAEINAVPDDELIPVNIDLPTAITTALGALPKLRAMRPDIARHLPTFDLVRFDKLESYILATEEAHVGYLAAAAPPAPLEGLVAKAFRIRELLLRDVQALVGRGLIEVSCLERLAGTNGYKNIAIDVQTLARVIRDRWELISARTGVEKAELEDATRVGEQILAAVGQRERAPERLAEASLVRQRVFTLFVRTYELARRAAIYLRADLGDADEIAPSLYAARRHRRARGGVGAVAPAAVSGPNGASTRDEVSQPASAK